MLRLLYVEVKVKLGMEDDFMLLDSDVVSGNREVWRRSIRFGGIWGRRFIVF